MALKGSNELPKSSNAMSRFLTLIIGISLIFSTVLPLSCSNSETVNDSVDNTISMKLTLDAGEYKITKDDNGLDVIQMEGFSSTVSPGDPMLPHKVYNILVPPDAIWSSLRLNIISAETHVLKGTYDMKPASPDVTWADGRWIEDWGEGKDIVNGRNMNVCGTDARFPESYLKLLPYSQMRKWKLTKVDFTPFQYNPVSQKLTLIQSVVIEISCSQSPAELDESLIRDTAMDDIAPQLFYNYQEAKGWYKED